MKGLNRIILLIVTMTTISLIVVGIATFLLYRTALYEEKTRLVETAQSQARLIEAVARHDAIYSLDYPGGAEKASLDQINDAHASYEGFGETGEFTLARRVGDEIIFLLRHRHSDLEFPKPVPFESELAEPMRLALSEMSGTVIGLDYRGEKVLAAYEPVGELNLGIVAKIDLVEIQSPFIRAGLITLGFAFLAIVLGAMLFFRITNPMIKRLAESEVRFRSLVETSPDGITLTDLDGKILTCNPQIVKIHGFESQEEIVGKSSLEFISHEYQQKAIDNIERTLQEGTVTNVEYVLLKKDGTHFFGELSASLLTDKEGKPMAFMAVTRDISEKKQAEDALRDSKERYFAIFNQAADSIVLVEGETGKLVEFNDEALENLGYTREEFEKLKIPDFEVIESPEEVTKHIEKIIRDGADTFETKHRTKGGEIRDILVNSKAISIGGKDFVQSIWTDITERKKAEEALRESEGKYRDLVEKAGLAVMIDDKEGKFSYFNEKCLEFFRYSAGEMKKQSVQTITHPEDLERVMKLHFDRFQGKKVPSRYEFKGVRKDGSVIYLEVDVVVLKKEESIIGTRSYVWDITERKQAEEALRGSEEKFRLLTEKSVFGIFIIQDSIMAYVNQSLARTLGYKPEEIINKLTFKDLIHPDEMQIVMKRFQERLDGKIERGNIVYKAVRKDGSLIFTEVFGSLIEYNGRPAVMGTMIDVSDRMKAEEEKDRLQAQLVQSEKMAGIGTLTSGIAHEFNNLLQIMSGHSEFAKRTKKPEDMEEALEIVENTSERVSKIIKDLLTFSRREPLERKHSSIPELIDFVLSMTEEQMKKNNIMVVREYGRVPKIEVNTGEMQQVFLNLVTNARDAMLPRGGKLEIRTKKVKDHVEVSFTDTGIGIDEEALSRVFEPFYTTKGAVGGDTRIQGIGLGLSVSYGIVERHGGTIEVESEAGKGTTFTIRLPAKVEKAKERVVKDKIKPKAKKTKPRSVLVVDDEEEICKMLTKWLSAEGHKVKSALTGKKALDLVKKESFDIVFLDIVMPGILAIDTLAEIQEISPKTKVFMITGKLVDKELWKELKEKGASGYLQKPFKIENIKNCLARIRD